MEAATFISFYLVVVYGEVKLTHHGHGYRLPLAVLVAPLSGSVLKLGIPEFFFAWQLRVTEFRVS